MLWETFRFANAYDGIVVLYMYFMCILLGAECFATQRVKILMHRKYYSYTD